MNKPKGSKIWKKTNNAIKEKNILKYTNNLNDIFKVTNRKCKIKQVK